MSQEVLPEVFVFPNNVRVANIDLDFLRKSSMIRSSGSNNPGPLRPLQSWELIDQLENLMNSISLPFQRKEIWVEKKNSNRILTNEEVELYTPENTPINKWVFDHVLTKFEIIPESIREGYAPAIALSFTQSGIKVVWGLHVHVCQNLCIFGENSISTYGRDKIPFAKQMNILEFWIQNVEEKYKEDLAIMDRMKSKAIDTLWINECIGDLYRMAINKAYKKGEAPLNTANLSILVQKLNPESLSSVWDFYNAGTEIIKPTNISIEDVFNVNMSWGKYLSEKATI